MTFPRCRWSRSLAPACVVGAACLVALAPAKAQRRANYEELQAFSAVLNHIRLNYVDSVEYRSMVRAAIDGLLRSLDPHSYYVSPEFAERRAALEEGDLGAPGVILENVDGMITVLAVIPGSPAEDKRILPGDRLRAVNDTSVAGQDARAVQLALAGRKGSKVRLSLERGPRLEPERYTVTVERKNIVSPSVPLVTTVDDSTGYLWLAEFGPNGREEVEDAIRALQRRDAKRVILDLRGNPGGAVQSSVEIASLFFPESTLVFHTSGRKPDLERDYFTERNGRFRDLPLIVLVDERSASAAEALAGSLQDHDRALIVGRRSFGKALIQGGFPLPGGGVVWLTVGHVVTPSGRVIQRRYRGLDREQYLAFAGRSGAREDTVAVFATDAGRPVRGGGGIVPDVEMAPRAKLPVWFTIAADTGLIGAVADSAAYRLGASQDAWLEEPERWERQLLVPFLERVRATLNVEAAVAEDVALRIASLLALRPAEVLWGAEARNAYLMRNDPALQAALAHFGRLEELLASPTN